MTDNRSQIRTRGSRSSGVIRAASAEIPLLKEKNSAGSSIAVFLIVLLVPLSPM
jgi:hypothetical protein